MDPLFERRNLMKKVHIHSKFLQKNMQVSILSQLKINYEGRCSSEGFVQPNSITILDYSLGRANYIKGGVDYDVSFQADVCMPHPGQRFKAPVTLRSKIGIHAETPPIRILIPRDLHMGNDDFENIKVGDDIEFEVVGAQFKQQDVDIIIVGKLVSKIEEEIEMPLNVAPVVQEFTPEVQSQEGEEKRIIIAPSQASELPKKRKLRRTGGEEVNEHFPSFPQGVA
jgi:DNA-directed RNA polymerase subunit E'/Rpb7